MTTIKSKPGVSLPTRDGHGALIAIETARWLCLCCNECASSRCVHKRAAQASTAFQPFICCTQYRAQIVSADTSGADVDAEGRVLRFGGTFPGAPLEEPGLELNHGEDARSRRTCRRGASRSACATSSHLPAFSQPPGTRNAPQVGESARRAAEECREIGWCTGHACCAHARSQLALLPGTD